MMARTDRLMRLMDVMRKPRPPVTAAVLAEMSGVSPRQLYRDIATLRAGGALIDGEAGVGYVLTEDTALPPQSFSQLEIEALLLAVQSLDRIGDAELTGAAREALSRIIATLPGDQPRQALHAVMRSFSAAPERDPPVIDLGLVRKACWEEQALELTYTDMAGQVSQRRVWPLGLSYSERHLMLLAHCRLRMDYRVFHINRISQIKSLDEHFRPQRVPLMRAFVALKAAQGSPDKKLNT